MPVDVNALQRAVATDELVRMTLEMVCIPSYGGIPRQETAVATYIKSIFDKEGIPCTLAEVADGRCNVTAVLKGKGAGKTLLLTGHTDTVAPGGMLHATEPFIKDGHIHGRGTSDMKGPLVCMMAAMIALKRLGCQLEGDIIFAGVADEEQASIGTIHLLEQGIRADGAIVGEPSQLEVCIAHRGLEWFEFHFIGKAVHGGRQKEGVNAIQKAVDFINEMNASLLPKVQARQHPLLVEGTLNAGVINGGTQLSTVAGECTLCVDRRFLPSEAYDAVVNEFKALIQTLEQRDPSFKCEMRVADESRMKAGFIHPPMEIEEKHPLVQAVDASILQQSGKKAVHTLFPAWTDGALLSHYAKIPTLVLGPGNIEQCHAPNECIAIEQLQSGYIAYALAAQNFCNQHL